METCKKLLNKVSEKNDLTLHWIPSHLGHRGNEIADRLAKLGTGTNTYGPALLLPVPISTSHTKQVLNNWAMVNHQTQWANREDCRQSRMAMPNAGIKIWNTLQNLNRRQMKVMSHMLTGHCVLKYHLNNMKIEGSPTCEQCDTGEQESAFHFIGQCPKFNNIRYDIFRTQFLTESQLQHIKVRSILRYVNITEIQ